MKIRFDEINDDGLILVFSGTEDVVSDALRSAKLPLGASVASVVKGEIRVEATDDGVRIQGTVVARVDLECSRCLTRYESDRPVTLDFVVHRVSDEAKAMDKALLEAQPNELVVVGNELDLGDLIVQEVLLDLPMQPLCTQECQGLCARCGAIKGSPECACSEEKSLDPRWEKLAGLASKS
ncbi:MAG: hypothetical protein QG577_1392 [Thermodesulfobacteriota bacterium]|nr:hypothetical protein [Thermodesulfobacteriota bacterium]